MALGNRVREVREQHGLSLRETCQLLAEGYHVWLSWDNLARIERLERPGADEVKLALARLFDVPVGELFFQEIVATSATDKIADTEVPA